MNITMYSRSLYSAYPSYRSGSFHEGMSMDFGNNKASKAYYNKPCEEYYDYLDKKAEHEEKERSDRKKSEQLRELIRSLNQTAKKNEASNDPYSGNTGDLLSGTSGSDEDEEEKLLKESADYNYKEVATKIRRAKTSISAGQAEISAKRKVLELKRKISTGKGDPKELQLALTHAKRMELVARKKKRHLELEELVEQTRKRDEKLDKLKEASEDMKNAYISLEEEKVSELKDSIYEDRQDILDEGIEYAKEEGLENSEDMLKELNEQISELGEEELKKLDEISEKLMAMEIIDPHMDEESLKKLREKHRSDENKAMVKADMDYLKEMINSLYHDPTGVPGTTSPYCDIYYPGCTGYS